MNSNNLSTNASFSTLNDLNHLLDPANLYCNEHKKLKKYYLRNEDYFLCEYDGYESHKNYCHFKDILSEYKDEVQRLKAAEVSQKEVVTQQTSDKLKTSVSKVHREAELFFKFMESFQTGYVQRLEKLTYINSEILKIKDILSHINFREDGSVNFINIGANEAKELKILTLANILVRRRMGANEKEINFTQAFVEILREFHFLLVALARSSRTWIESSANEIYSELASLEENSKLKTDLSKEEFGRQIYFNEEMQEMINSFQAQISEKNSVIESLRSQVNSLNISVSQTNNTVTQLNITINQNAMKIQENNNTIINLKNALDELNGKYAALLQEKNALADKLGNLSFMYESLILEFNAAKESFAQTARLHLMQIEEITSIKKRLELELSEERNKYKVLVGEYEKLKGLYDGLVSQNELVCSEAEDKDEQISRLMEKLDLAVSTFEAEKARLLVLISNHENTIKQLNFVLEDTRLKYDSALREERNKYNLLLIEIEKLKGEIQKLNQLNLSNTNETNITIKNLNIKISETEKNLRVAQQSAQEAWGKFNRESEENAKLKKIISELEYKIKESSNIIIQLSHKLEISLSEIRTLQTEIVELNKEKRILMESEEKLIEENNYLSDELETLKKNHSELLIELKAQMKQNEILSLQVEELEFQLKSESHKSQEITLIQSTKTTEFRSRMELIIHSKEKLENELSERKNAITHFNSEIEILRAKHEASLNEIASLKQQLRTIPVLQENLVLLGHKLDGVSNTNKNLESTIAHKDTLILQLEQELKNCRNQNEEMTVIIHKHKESIYNLQNYESKLNALENTRLEIEELKKKIKDAEELNSSMHRSRSGRRSRSIFNRSVVENLDKFGSVASEEIISRNSDSAAVKSFDFVSGHYANNIQVIRKDVFVNDEPQIVSCAAGQLVSVKNVFEQNIDKVFVVPHKPAAQVDLISTTEIIQEHNGDGVFVVPHKPAAIIETITTEIVQEQNSDGVFAVPHKSAAVIETSTIEIVQEHNRDEVFAVPHKPAGAEFETNTIEIVSQSRDEVFVVPHKPAAQIEIESITTTTKIVSDLKDEIFIVPHKPAGAEIETNITTIVQELKDEVFIVPHKPAGAEFEISTETITTEKTETITTEITELRDEVFVVPHKPVTHLELQLSTEAQSLINKTQTEQISFWLTESLKIQNLGLKQLFKASADGFSSAAFKSKCNKKANTVTIARTNHGKLIGGFTPIAWESPTEGTHVYEEDETETSFLFSLTLNEKYPIKPSLRQFAVCNTQAYGPLFGGGSDLEIVDECDKNFNSFSCTDHTYASKRSPFEFYGHEEKYLIEDYEVYEVVSRE